MHNPRLSARAQMPKPAAKNATAHARRRALLAAACAASAMLGLQTQAWSGSFSWDGDGLAPVNGGFGLWDNLTPRWSGGSGFVAWNDANNDDALFGGNPGHVVLFSNRTANSLTFSSDYALLHPASGLVSINLGSGNLVDTGSARVDVQTTLAGSAGLTKNGSGVFIFHGTNSGLSGAWNINAGMIAPGSANASIPAGTVVSIASGASLDLGITGGAYNATVGHLLGDGNVRLETQSRLGVITGSMLTVTGGAGAFNGFISGDGGRLHKSGSATFTIDNIQTYTGITMINGGSTGGTAGALVINAAGGLSDQSGIYFGTGTLNSATLLLNGGAAMGKSLGSLAGGGSLSNVNMQIGSLTIGADNRNTQFNGVLSGTGRLFKTGVGQQAFGTNASTWTGGLTIKDGMFLAQLDSRLGAIPGVSDPVNITLDGGAFGNSAGTSYTLSATRGITVTANNGGIHIQDPTTSLTVPGTVSGPGRITKTGGGSLQFNNSGNSFAGGFDIADGQVSTIATGGTPLGSGPVALSGGNLTLSPTLLGANVTYAFGDLNYGPGASLRLVRDNTLTANFGALTQQAGGTLVLVPTTGIAELGGGGANFIRVTSTGVVPNNVNGGIPATNGDIASPSIISMTSGTDFTGDFVRYGANGFERGTYSTSANINTATANDVFNATANQAIAASASVFALRVTTASVTGGTLNVLGSATEPPTIILNGGTLSGGVVNFGDRPGIIYTGGPAATTTSAISSTLSGSGEITKIGGSNLLLSSAANFSGGLTLAGGTVTTGAANVLPSTVEIAFKGRGPTGTATNPRLTLNGTTQTVAAISSDGPGATIDLGAGGTLIVSGATSSQYRGAITGTIGSTLIKQGSGVLTLSETVSTTAVPSTTNSYQRLSIRQGGVVAVSSSNSLPPTLNPSMFPVLSDTIRLDGGTLRIMGRNDIALNSTSTFTIASGTAQRGVSLQSGGGIIHVDDPLEIALLQVDNTTSRNIISGTGNLTKTGPGALRFGPGNTYSGQTTLLQGTLQIPADSALGAAPGVLDPERLQIQNAAIIQSLGNVTLNNNRGINLLGGSGTISNQFEAATIDTSGGSFIADGGITGPGALKKIGAGTGNTLELNTPNDFFGNFTIEAGRVNFNSSDSAGLAQIVVDPKYPVVLGKQGVTDTFLNNEVVLEDGSVIDVDVATGAGSLILNGDISGSNSFSKLGGGALALNGLTSTFSGHLHVLAGTVVAASEQALGTSAGATLVAPGATLAFEGDINHASAEPTYIAGTGVGAAGAVQNLFGGNVYGGNITLSSDATIGVSAGSLKVGSVVGRSTVTKIGSGPLTVERVRVAGLNVNEATVQIAPKAALGDPADTSYTNTLTIAGGTTPTATLDITNNAMVVDYPPTTGDAEPFDTIRAQIIAAFNAGNWDGNGITSSLLAPGSQYGIGYSEGSVYTVQVPIPAVFAGADDTSVLIRYTRLGDATLDGVVSIPDFNRLAANFGATAAVWSQGDFNYDGIINLQDFNRLANNFGLQAGPDGPTPEDWAALAAAVPEPSGMMIGGFIACGILLRRFRGMGAPPTSC